MLKIALIATSAVALAIAIPSLASAKSIKELMSPDDLASYCQTAGANTETTSTVTLKDGTVLTGTIHCEVEDMFGATADDDDDASDVIGDTGSEDDNDDSGTEVDSGDDGHSGDTADTSDDSGDHDSGSDDDSAEADDD